MDDMRPPPRPPGFQHLPKKTRKRLKREGLSIIQPADLRQLMDDRDIRETKGTGREGPFKLSDDGIVLMLCWDGKEPVFTQLLQIADWEELCGPVRDQLKHIICWAYSSTDLVSALRCIRHLDAHYSPLARGISAQMCIHICLGKMKVHNRVILATVVQLSMLWSISKETESPENSVVTVSLAAVKYLLVFETRTST